MTYVSPTSQKQTLIDALKDNAMNPPPSVRAVSTFANALSSPMLLAETTVIELDDGGPGHAALHIDNDGTGQPFLYDPAGSYLPKNGIRDGDLMSGEDANLTSYMQYWQNNGDNVRLHKLDTTPAQEQSIMERAEQIGNVSPGLCATSVSSALHGVCGVESSIWPSTLGKNVDHANCK
jgi:hypothetical protein